MALASGALTGSRATTAAAMVSSSPQAKTLLAAINPTLATSLGMAPPPVRERWVGTYAVADGRTYLIDAPSDDVRLVIVTSGTGASTGFGIAERTIAGLFGSKGVSP